MIEIPVLDTNGKRIGEEKLDPAILGGRVRLRLLKQAVVAYRANARQGTVATKSRGMVQGSSRKIYRQKGTGRARAGNVRTPVRVGGGRAFAKVTRDYSQKMNRKMRRLARNSAILAKAKSGTAMILSGLTFDKPATGRMAGILKAADASKGALIALDAANPNMQKSGRNIPALHMKLIQEVNAYDVLKARKLVFTPESFSALVADPVKAGHGAEA
ncbi:MAG: 50S ribosomal protein L4 [Phycisphaerae bacterium]